MGKRGGIMKKIISLFFAVLFIFTFSVCAFGEEISVEEFELTLTFPENWLAVTKDSTADEEVFKDYLYYEDTMQYLEETGLPVYAITKDGTDDFEVQLEYHTDYYSFGDLSSSDFKELCNQLETTWSSYGYSDCKAEAYSCPSGSFVKIKYNYLYDGNTVYAVDYVGYIDNVYCVFSYYSYDGVIHSEELKAVDDIVGRVKSSNVLPENESTGSSPRFSSRSIKAIGSAIIASIAGIFAWIKAKFGKKKETEDTVLQSTETFENPAPETPVDKFDFKCPGCGAMISEDEHFCPLCGEKIK